jgi:hypothetical protein
MRVRLRELLSPRDQRRLYAEPHQHTKWFDHRVRVDVTVAVATRFLGAGGIIADLSCGDAAIPRRIAELCNTSKITLGDFAPGYELTGPIERTIEQIEPNSVNLWVCSETIEHLDDPDAVLAQIRKRADTMVLSTPDGETDPSRNPEHLWGWDSEAVEKMLRDTGWKPLVKTSLDLRPAGYEYCYQIWMVE